MVDAAPAAEVEVAMEVDVDASGVVDATNVGGIAAGMVAQL